MSKISQFSSENLLMSIGGHLALVAIMITSFAIVVHRAHLVAPDRIEITEIDLSTVKVSGDETRLYNTAAPADSAPDVVPAPPKAPEQPDPAPVPEPITQPSLAEPEPQPEEKPEEKPEQPKNDHPVEDLPAPRKKTVVRVNRETVSLDRTLTISVVDALRVAMTRCWTIDTSRDDISDIRAVAHLTMRQNGTVRDLWFEGAAAAETDPAFAYVLDTIRAAINVCQPFKMLPPGEFAKWEKIQLTFYPSQGKVM